MVVPPILYQRAPWSNSWTKIFKYNIFPWRCKMYFSSHKRTAEVSICIQRFEPSSNFVCKSFSQVWSKNLFRDSGTLSANEILVMPLQTNNFIFFEILQKNFFDEIKLPPQIFELPARYSMHNFCLSMQAGRADSIRQIYKREIHSTMVKVFLRPGLCNVFRSVKCFIPAVRFLKTLST